MGFVVMLHGLWRWVVLLVALAAIIAAFSGWFGKRKWTPLDDRLGLFYTVAFDIQALLGIIIYAAVLFGAYIARWYAGSLPRLTFEHVVMMFIALAIAHVARSRAKKGTEPLSKHRTSAIGFLISVVIVLVSIPTWGFM